MRLRVEGYCCWMREVGRGEYIKAWEEGGQQMEKGRVRFVDIVIA